MQETLPSVADHLTWLTDFAGKWRYQRVEEMDSSDRDTLRSQIAELRVWVVARISILVPPEALPASMKTQP